MIVKAAITNETQRLRGLGIGKRPSTKRIITSVINARGRLIAAVILRYHLRPHRLVQQAITKMKLTSTVHSARIRVDQGGPPIVKSSCYRISRSEEGEQLLDFISLHVCEAGRESVRFENLFKITK